MPLARCDLPNWVRWPGGDEIHFPDGFLDGISCGQRVQLGHLEQVARCPALGTAERGPDGRQDHREICGSRLGGGQCPRWSLIPRPSPPLLPADIGTPFPG